LLRRSCYVRWVAVAASAQTLILEDYDDQDVFNSFSGNSGVRIEALERRLDALLPNSPP